MLSLNKQARLCECIPLKELGNYTDRIAPGCFENVTLKRRLCGRQFDLWPHRGISFQSPMLIFRFH